MFFLFFVFSVSHPYYTELKQRDRERKRERELYGGHQQKVKHCSLQKETGHEIPAIKPL